MPLSTCILPGKPFHICQERTNELSIITSLYQDMRSSSVEPVVTTLYLTGPPGSGKTQLARQFGEQFLKTTPTTTINPPLALTLNAESVQSLLKSTKDVTKKLGLTTEPKKKPEIFGAVLFRRVEKVLAKLRCSVASHLRQHVLW